VAISNGPRVVVPGKKEIDDSSKGTEIELGKVSRKSNAACVGGEWSWEKGKEIS
jgi:hypothetical protein